MSVLTISAIVIASLAVTLLAMSVRVVKQYEKGVLLRLGRVHAVREPGLTFIIPVVDVLRRVSLRTVTMPIQSQGIITKDNVSIDVAGVAYFHVADALKSVVVIENVAAAVNQIAQTTLRNVVGQHTLDQALSETDAINQSIREILDRTTTEWGVLVTLVELKDIQLPESMKRALSAFKGLWLVGRRVKISRQPEHYPRNPVLAESWNHLTEPSQHLEAMYGARNSSTVALARPASCRATRRRRPVDRPDPWHGRLAHHVGSGVR